MSKRFITRERNLGGYDYAYECYDTKADVVLGCDGGEPEDNSFDRDWSWVLPLLNSLAEEIETLDKELRESEQENAEINGALGRYKLLYEDLQEETESLSGLMGDT